MIFRMTRIAAGVALAAALAAPAYATTCSNGAKDWPKCTPPAWPFPRDIYMDHTHFAQLRAVKGDRAKRLQQNELLRRAFEVEKLPVPAYVLDPKSTLRAIVKRGNQLQRRARV